MLQHLIANLRELKGIYHLERMRRKRLQKPEKHIIRLLNPQNTTQWHLAVSAAAECIKSGGIVAVPTDTLYGLCTLAEYADRLYKLKKRPSEKPLGLIINEPEQITNYAVQTVPNGLLKNLFPGPVTVLFNRTPKVPVDFNPGISSVAFRIPQARFVRDLCQFLPYQLISQTSANISGTDKNPICIEDFQELWDEIDLIIDGGVILENNGSRLGSTIIDLSTPGQYKLIRAGCAEMGTIHILREFGLKSQEEADAPRLESADKKRLQFDNEEKMDKEIEEDHEGRRVEIER